MEWTFQLLQLRLLKRAGSSWPSGGQVRSASCLCWTGSDVIHSSSAMIGVSDASVN